MTDLSGIFGKVEMEQAAGEIIKQARQEGSWAFAIDIDAFDGAVLFGLTCLMGYGWLEFIPGGIGDSGQECWKPSREFIRRAALTCVT